MIGVILMFVGGGILVLAGFYGMLGIVLAAPVVGIATGFAGLSFSLWPFIGIGIGFFILFLIGIFLIRMSFSGEYS